MTGPRTPATEGKPASAAAEAGLAAGLRPRGRPRGSQTRLLHEGAGELGRHHFAFLRALLDGIDLEAAWRRYLAFSGGPHDRRHFASQLRRLVNRVDQAGRLRGCAAEAGLVVPALRALPDHHPVRGVRAVNPAPEATPADRARPAPPQAPSLDDWRSAYCGAKGIDEDFYSAAEWLELYADAVGAVAAIRGPGRASAGQSHTAPSPALPAMAHARQAEAVDSRPVARIAGPSAAQRKAVLDALGALERALAREAGLSDDTGFWLGAGLPRQLATVGVKSLGDLVHYVNLHGYRWHRRVPRLGVVRAHRLLDWLAPIADAQGRPLKELARRPSTDIALRRRRELGEARPGEARLTLVPLFDGTLPDALSGRQGAFRSSEVNVWGADTDVQAVAQWLSRYRGQTRRDYTRIAERFYLWSVHVRRKPLSSLLEGDLQAYQAFVAAPPADWVQERKVRREDPAWRPFRGPLGRNSQRHEFTVLGSLFGTLLEKGYLRANAMARLGRSLGLVKPSIDVRRSLDERQWAFALQVLLERPDGPQRRRLQLLLELGRGTGLRLSELATTRMKGFRRERVDGEPAWLLDVVGKGGKLRTVVVFDGVKALIERHHADMDAAGLGFDARVEQVQLPATPPATAAGVRSASVPAAPAEGRHPSLQAALQAEQLEGWRPLIGILKRPPPRRDLDARGLPFVDRNRPAQADRFGALERSAIYKLLRRFFADVARAAVGRDGAPPAGDFLRASTHWLRHSFANEAIKHMPPQVVQSLMGHSDLRVTSVYVKAGAEDLVRGMRALRRADGGRAPG